MRFVIIESPFNAPTRSGVELNKRYAQVCMLDALLRGEAPFASHLLYTQMLDDKIEVERNMGIEAGLELAKRADASCFYLDRGFSTGMQLGLEAAQLAGRKVYFRRLSESPISRVRALGTYYGRFTPP